jgi:hypothetical protein
MSSLKPHCSVDYHEFSGGDLESQGHKVSTGIYGNSGTFTTPPMTKTVFDQLVEDVHNTYEAYIHGGADQKGAYMTARTALITALDTIAKYVDGLSGVNEDMIVLAGFTPTKTGQTKAVVPVAPEIDINSIDTKTKGWLKLTCKNVQGAEFYGCIVLEQPLNDSVSMLFGQVSFSAPSGPGPVPFNVRMVVTKGRYKEVPGLTSAREYWVYFYAGNTAGVSPLSNGVSVVCG